MVIQALTRELRRNDDLASMMSAVKGSPGNYINMIKRRGEFVDHIFLSMMNVVIDHDIVLRPFHQETHQDNYLLIPGGAFGTDKRSSNEAIFIAYYEESKFQAGHYHCEKYFHQRSRRY